MIHRAGVSVRSFQLRYPRVSGFGKGDYDALLKLGPNIKDWPEIAPLGDNLLLKVASYITDLSPPPMS